MTLPAYYYQDPSNAVDAIRRQAEAEKKYLERVQAKKAKKYAEQIKKVFKR